MTQSHPTDLLKKNDEGLLPCPFCGGCDLRRSSRTSGHGESTDYIACENCGGRLEDYYGKPEQNWNTRAYATALRSALECIESMGKALEDARGCLCCIRHTTAPAGNLIDDTIQHAKQAIALAAPFRKARGDGGE